MSISGNYPPSKTAVLVKTGQPTMTLQSSTLWYIHADEDDPASMVVRYQNPLSPASSSIIYSSFTGVADTVAPLLGLFVKVTPVTTGSVFAPSFPRIPFWFNVCLFKNLEDQATHRKLTLGTSNASESLHVTESYAALRAAIDAAGTDVPSSNFVSATPLGNSQGAARQVPIVRGAGNYTVFITGTSTNTNNGVRLDMVAEDGTTVIPATIGTEVTVYSSAIFNAAINLYPQTGGAINGAAANAPYVFDRSSIFTLICVSPNAWAIKGNEFGTIDADAIFQNDLAAQLQLGSPVGEGVIALSSPASAMTLSIGDAGTGFKYDTTLGTTTVFSNGQGVMALLGGSTLQLGGGGSGEEGNMVSKPLNVAATTPDTAYPPKRLMDIASVAGGTPSIRLNGDAGSECFIRNTTAGAVVLLDDAGATITTIAAGTAVHVVSWDMGLTWVLANAFAV